MAVSHMNTFISTYSALYDLTCLGTSRISKMIHYTLYWYRIINLRLVMANTDFNELQGIMIEICVLVQAACEYAIHQPLFGSGDVIEFLNTIDVRRLCRIVQIYNAFLMNYTLTETATDMAALALKPARIEFMTIGQNDTQIVQLLIGGLDIRTYESIPGLLDLNRPSTDPGYARRFLKAPLIRSQSLVSRDLTYFAYEIISLIIPRPSHRLMMLDQVLESLKTGYGTPIDPADELIAGFGFLHRTSQLMCKNYLVILNHNPKQLLPKPSLLVHTFLQRLPSQQHGKCTDIERQGTSLTYERRVER
ncbi:hypothetical protein VNO77_22939 [Canavalia gladiata]|uniref:Uncharacterized protein n=1 Tax=Canavalia gladiata TaxID=3824 RepID=A0AAN9L3J4_CANGL